MNEAKLQVSASESVRDQLAQLREQQERLFVQLHAGEQHFKQLARSVWRVQEDERRRLARELHDGIGQQLTALRHRLDALARSVDGAGDASNPLHQALAICDSAIQETRALSRVLRSIWPKRFSVFVSDDAPSPPRANAENVPLASMLLPISGSVAGGAAPAPPGRKASVHSRSSRA